MSISNESKEEIDPSAEMAQNDQDRETRSEQEGWVFDEKQKYYPVFFLTDIPGDYYAEMYRGMVHDITALVAISSNSPTNVIEDLKTHSNAEGALPKPFFNSTVEEVYEFFKNHLRPADDDPRGFNHTFSYFTFLVVDADCVKSEPWQCILCCDAPDFGDPHPETRLKQPRLPIARAVEGLAPLEHLSQTPSEFVHKPDFVLGMIPSCWEVELHNNQSERVGLRVIASPGDARGKKSHSVWKQEEAARQLRAEKSAARRKL